ncbi:MAG: MFS transporter [archaeon]|nr:MFS transporter [archaeon]MCP8305745.1 MFS transporter [archaeon]
MKRHWTMLIVAFLAAFSFLFSMQAIPPVLPSIMSEYDISHTVASSLMFLVALPAIFISVLGGIFTSKYGVKMVGLVGLALISIGGLLSINPSFLALEIGRLVIGIGGALVMTASPALLSQWFPHEKMAFGMGIFGLNMPLATILSFNLLGKVGTDLGWRSSLLITLIISVIGLLIWMFLTKERRAPDRTNTGSPFSGLKSRQIWILGLIWATFNMAAISFTTWGPKLFENLWEATPTSANFLASLLMIGALFTPLTGHLSDRSRRRRLPIISSALGVAASFFLIPFTSGGGLVLVLLFLGLAAAFITPSVFALPLEMLDERSVSLGFGILNTCLNVGIVVGPLLVGFVIDSTYSKIAIFSVMMVFAIASTLLGFALKSK